MAPFVPLLDKAIVGSLHPMIANNINEVKNKSTIRFKLTTPQY